MPEIVFLQFKYNKSAEHLKNTRFLKISESIKNAITPSTSTSFVDCGEINIKQEFKEEEETIDEDPLSIKMEAKNVEVTIKHEIEEDIQEKDSYDDRINTIGIVEHKIEYDDNVN